ncbi:MAG TPA: TetR/AcrR family transcriptional regulator [Solirubrobacterales bacterium]|jgi:AcrR family transcriptional regulator|nr:TetR/AcrR family transcriptional regulator [Solirubrobacterales bacterium]
MTSTRPELPREFVASHKRRRMMDAVAELTAANGYEATKIADIVRRAAVARKTLYDNFDGKEDLFLSAIDATMTEMRVVVEDACAEAGSKADGIVAGLEALLDFIAEHPAASRMCMVESISATPSSARLYDSGMRAFVDLLRKNVPEGADLPETIEESLVGGVAWILQLQIRRGEAEGVGELLPELSQFVLSPYLGVGKVVDTGRRK